MMVGESVVHHWSWCTRGDALEVTHQRCITRGWCTRGDAPEVDAPEVHHQRLMHQRWRTRGWCTRGWCTRDWCTRGDAPEMVQQRWCTRCDAAEVMHHVNKRDVGTLPPGSRVFPIYSEFLKRDPSTVWFYPYLVHRVLAEAVVEHLVVGVQHHHHLQRVHHHHLWSYLISPFSNLFPRNPTAKMDCEDFVLITSQGVLSVYSSVKSMRSLKIDYILAKKKLSLIFCPSPPEENGDIFYVDGFDPFLGLNIFGNLHKSWFGHK